MNELYNKVRSTSPKEKIIFKNQTYQFYNVERKLWKEFKNEILKNRFWLRRKMTGGFVLGKEIYIDKSRKIGRKKLILHEIGHVLGYGHTWKPTLMNPTWFFRWIKKF